MPITITHIQLGDSINVYDVVEGPDGNMWFTGESSPYITMITPSGVITQFDLAAIFYPTLGSAAYQFQLYGICAGPDGNIWFTETSLGYIGKCTPAGDVTLYHVPNSNDWPYNICAGPDGNLWFCAVFGKPNGYIGVMNTSGVMLATYPRTGSAPEDICLGPDNNLWVVDGNFNDVTKMTPSGVSTIYGGLTTNCFPWAICVGPDNNLWFVENSSGKIGTMSTDGVLLGEFLVPIPAGYTYTNLSDICTGPDGNLWFTNRSSQLIGTITTAGVITEYPDGDKTPSNGGNWNIAPGPSNTVWFTENVYLGFEVGIIQIPVPKLCTPPPSFGKLQLINDGYKAFADNLYK